MKNIHNPFYDCCCSRDVVAGADNCCLCDFDCMERALNCLAGESSCLLDQPKVKITISWSPGPATILFCGFVFSPGETYEVCGSWHCSQYYRQMQPWICFPQPCDPNTALMASASWLEFSHEDWSCSGDIGTVSMIAERSHDCYINMGRGGIGMPWAANLTNQYTYYHGVTIGTLSVDQHAAPSTFFDTPAVPPSWWLQNICVQDWRVSGWGACTQPPGMSITCASLQITTPPCIQDVQFGTATFTYNGVEYTIVISRGGGEWCCPETT